MPGTVPEYSYTVGIYAKPAKTAKPVPNLVRICRFGIYTSINAKPEMIHNSTNPGIQSIFAKPGVRHTL